MQVVSKICKGCGVDKPLSEYHKNRQLPDGKHTICKRCNIDKVAQWRQDNPEKYRDHNYSKYGLTYDDYENLLDKVSSMCEICGVHKDDAPRSSLFVDHCHNSEKVRGVAMSALQ